MYACMYVCMYDECMYVCVYIYTHQSYYQTKKKVAAKMEKTMLNQDKALKGAERKAKQVYIYVYTYTHTRRSICI